MKKRDIENRLGWCWGTYGWAKGPHFFLSVGTATAATHEVGTSFEMMLPRKRVFYVARLPR